MNKTAIYHVCLSSHKEVMFRSPEDFRIAFNCLATAALSTNSRLLADGFMTTHYHVLVQTTSLKEFVRRTRYAYARYFNTKNHRTGRLGEERYFNLVIDGHHHSIAALNYVIRQGLHHGVATTPFEYPYCSAGAYFRQELGRFITPPLMKDHNRHRYLPSNVKIPTNYRMSADGQLLREDILDVTWVEQAYVTPKNFLFQMGKFADAKDIQNQKEENQLPPVTMETIEAGVPGFSLSEAEAFERSKGNPRAMTDLELCAYIDTQLLPKSLRQQPAATSQPAASIYLLSQPERAKLANWIWRKSREDLYQKGSADSPFANKTVTEPQLRRCLALD
ncbi:MAG: hypothetical protein J6T09_03815 [Bacteroidales bacterium]|nr:hypothetical protein [Bacteroidales bacterium]